MVAQLIGNTTDYFITPCAYTLKYYEKQINDALIQAFKENQHWKNPGSKVQVVKIINDISEWYDPFRYTSLESSTYNQMWAQAMRELQDLLMKKVPSKNSFSVDSIGLYYSPEKIKGLIERIKSQGGSVETIAYLSGIPKNTIYKIITGKGPYKSRRITKVVNNLISFLESLGFDTNSVVKGEKNERS